MKKRFVFCLFVLLSINHLSAQPILYGVTADDSKIYKINVTTCEICIILDVLQDCPAYGIYDLLVLPNGDILVLCEFGLRRYDPPSNTPVWSNNVIYSGALLAPDNTIYLTSSDGNGNCKLWIFDPSNNSVTLVGDFPSNMVVYEMFIQNGVVYGTGSEFINGNWGNPRVFQIDLVNPGNTTVVQPFPLVGLNGGLTNTGYDTHTLGLSRLAQYNVATNTSTELCFFGTGIRIAGLTDLPSNVPAEPCACLSNAGNLIPNQYVGCGTNPITIPNATGTTLDANDLLRYVVFTNINDTIGSIILQNTNNVIAFNPGTMQQGVVYYVAAAAGNGLNGNVDLNDPCLDFSNVVTIIWYPKPSVTFSAPNVELCQGGCLNLNVQFAGLAPFSLTGQVLSGSTVIGSFNQAYASNTAVLEVCVPANVPLGTVQVKATSLTDRNCNCL